MELVITSDLNGVGGMGRHYTTVFNIKTIQKKNSQRRDRTYFNLILMSRMY